jgi:hypothetical protein
VLACVAVRVAAPCTLTRLPAPAVTPPSAAERGPRLPARLPTAGWAGRHSTRHDRPRRHTHRGVAPAPRPAAAGCRPCWALLPQPCACARHWVWLQPQQQLQHRPDARPGVRAWRGTHVYRG